MNNLTTNSIENNKSFNGIVAYLRYSDHKQDDGFSIEYQTREIKDFAEQNGIKIYKYFIDKAQTATKISGREEFFALLNAVKSGDVKIILVYKLSRMFRNTYESSKYRELFRKHGVRLMSVTQAVDEDTSAGRLTTNIMASIDQYQSETISDHVKSSMREMARQGFYTGGQLRYGYTLKKVPNGTKTRKVFIPHPTEASVVKKIFEMYVGGYSLGMIRNYLNDNNITSKYGKPFSTSFISRIIEDDMYIGTYRYKTKGYDDIVTENCVPKLVDKDIWQKANYIKQSKHNTLTPEPRRTKRLYALTGKVYCGYCGGHFIGFGGIKTRNEIKKEYLYYLCKERKIYKRCECKFIQKEYLETVTLNAVTTHILNDDKITELSIMIAEMCQNSPTELNKKIQENTKQKNKLEKGLEKLFDLLIDGDIDSDILKIKMSKIEAELNQTNKLLFTLNEQLKNVVTPKTVQLYLNDMLKKATSNNSEEIKIIFDNFVNKIIVTDSTVDIKLNVATGDKNIAINTDIKRQ